MKILIIGGTLFVGRHYVAAALEYGHDVTIFHRGQLKLGVTQIIGDRETDLYKLKGQTWDLVIDTCCYLPHTMKITLDNLKDSIGFYLFVSTISVYSGDIDLAKNKPSIINEESATLSINIEADDSLNNGQNYGENKLACEQVLEKQMPKKSLIIRPGTLTGPYDITSRLTYWLERFQYKGDVLAIRGPEIPVQWIDARDMCEWSLRMAEQGIGGIYNAVGPRQHYTAGDLFTDCKKLMSATNRVIYLPMAYIQTFSQWHLPPGGLGLTWEGQDNMDQICNERAKNFGLTFRDAKNTFIETFECSKKWNHAYYEKVGSKSIQMSSISEKMLEEKQLLVNYGEWLDAGGRESQRSK